MSASQEIEAGILQAEQTKLLYAGLPVALAANALLALILAAVQSPVTGMGSLLGWLGLLGTTLLGRVLLLAAWRREGLHAAHCDPRWIHKFRIGLMATSLVWGLASVLLFPTGDAPHQVFLAFVLAGLNAGAVTTLATDRLSVRIFLVLTLLPLVARLMLEGGAIALAMGVMSALFLMLLLLIAAQAGRILHENLRLRIEMGMRERMLLQSEARLKQAQEVSHMGSFDWNPASGELQCSDELFRLWGLAPASVTPGINALFQQGIHPDDVTLVEESIQRALHGGRFYECEHRVVWPDGGERYVRGKGEVLFDDAGQAVRMIGTVQDVTGQHQVEEALRAAICAAETANRAKSEFLASMSHELRTPLNAVLGFSQLFGMDPDLSEGTKAQARAIEHAGRHLLSIINDLIDLARVESGKLDYALAPVSAYSVMKDSLDMVAPVALRPGIELIQDGGGREVMVLADYARLRQVLINLLSNAIKYNRPQGKVTLSCRMEEGKVRINVSDTGLGIPAAKQARIFNAFDRLGAERGSIEGTGIGLVITKRLVEAMGGGIGFESEEGRGSSFWVEFPVAEAAETACPVAPCAGNKQNGKTNEETEL